MSENRIGEKDMYPHIGKFMNSLVYYYHQSLHDQTTIKTVVGLRIKLGTNFPEHDILTAFRTYGGINRIYSVEAKFNVDVNGVFNQARKRSKYCDYCYIAVPLDRDMYNFYNGLRDRSSSDYFSKIGFMIVDLESGNCGILKRASLNTKLNQEYKDKLFRTIYKKSQNRSLSLLNNPTINSKQITLEVDQH